MNSDRVVDVTIIDARPTGITAAWLLKQCGVKVLKDESNLNKLLLIKRESRELNELVRNISGVAEQGVRRLEQLAERDRTLDLRAMALPSGEVAAREVEAKTKERELLKAKGEDFEFALLLSQAEALNYGVHLAKVAAENESQPEAARQLSALSEELRGLHEQVVALIRKP